MNKITKEFLANFNVSKEHWQTILENKDFLKWLEKRRWKIQEDPKKAVENWKDSLSEDRLNELEKFFKENLDLISVDKIKTENKYFSSKEDNRKEGNYIYDKDSLFSLKIKFLMNYHFRNITDSVSNKKLKIYKEDNKSVDGFNSIKDFEKMFSKLNSNTFFINQNLSEKMLKNLYFFRQLMNTNIDESDEEPKPENSPENTKINKKEVMEKFEIDEPNYYLEFLFSVSILRNRNTVPSLDFLQRKIEKRIIQLEQEDKDENNYEEIRETYNHFIELTRFYGYFIKNNKRNNDSVKGETHEEREEELKLLKETQKEEDKNFKEAINNSMKFIVFFISTASLWFNLEEKTIKYYQTLNELKVEEQINKLLEIKDENPKYKKLNLFDFFKNVQAFIRHNLFYDSKDKKLFDKKNKGEIEDQSKKTIFIDHNNNNVIDNYQIVISQLIDLIKTIVEKDNLKFIASKIIDAIGGKDNIKTYNNLWNGLLFEINSIDSLRIDKLKIINNVIDIFQSKEDDDKITVKLIMDPRFSRKLTRELDKINFIDGANITDELTNKTIDSNIEKLKEFILLANPIEYKRKIKKFSSNEEGIRILDWDKTKIKRDYYSAQYLVDGKLIPQDERIQKLKIKFANIEQTPLELYEYLYLSNLSLLLNRHLKNYKSTVEENKSFDFKTTYDKFTKNIECLTPHSWNVKVDLRNNKIEWADSDNGFISLETKIKEYFSDLKGPKNNIVLSEEIKESIMNAIVNQPKTLIEENNFEENIGEKEEFSIELKEKNRNTNVKYTSNYWFTEINGDVELRKINLKLFPKIIYKKIESSKGTKAQKETIKKEVFEFLGIKYEKYLDKEQTKKFLNHAKITEEKWSEMIENKVQSSPNKYYVQLLSIDDIKDIKSKKNNISFPFYIIKEIKWSKQAKDKQEVMLHKLLINFSKEKNINEIENTIKNLNNLKKEDEGEVKKFIEKFINFDLSYENIKEKLIQFSGMFLGKLNKSITDINKILLEEDKEKIEIKIEENIFIETSLKLFNPTISIEEHQKNSNFDEEQKDRTYLEQKKAIEEHQEKLKKEKNTWEQTKDIDKILRKITIATFKTIFNSFNNDSLENNDFFEQSKIKQNIENISKKIISKILELKEETLELSEILKSSEEIEEIIKNTTKIFYKKISNEIIWWILNYEKENKDKDFFIKFLEKTEWYEYKFLIKEPNDLLKFIFTSWGNKKATKLKEELNIKIEKFNAEDETKVNKLFYENGIDFLPKPTEKINYLIDKVKTKDSYEHLFVNNKGNNKAFSTLKRKTQFKFLKEIINFLDTNKGEWFLENIEKETIYYRFKIFKKEEEIKKLSNNNWNKKSDEKKELKLSIQLKNVTQNSVNEEELLSVPMNYQFSNKLMKKIDKDNGLKVYKEKFINFIKNKVNETPEAFDLKDNDFEQLSKYFLTSLVEKIFTINKKISDNTNIDEARREKYQSLCQKIEDKDKSIKDYLQVNEKININSYYENHPERAIGKEFSKRYVVKITLKDKEQYSDVLVKIINILKEENFIFQANE